MLVIPSIAQQAELRVYRDAELASRGGAHRLAPAMRHCSWQPNVAGSGGWLQGEVRFAPGVDEMKRLHDRLPAMRHLEALPFPAQRVGAIIVGPHHACHAAWLGPTSGMGEQRLVFSQRLPFEPLTLRLAADLPLTVRLSHPALSAQATLPADTLRDEVSAMIDARRRSPGTDRFLGEVLLEIIEGLVDKGRLRITFSGTFSDDEYDELSRLARREAARRLGRALFGNRSAAAPAGDLALDQAPQALELTFRWRPGETLNLGILSVLDHDLSPAKPDHEPPDVPRTVYLSLDDDFPWPHYYYVKISGDAQPRPAVDKQARPPAFEHTLTVDSPAASWRRAPGKAFFWAVGGHRRHGDVPLPAPQVTGDRVIFGPPSSSG